MKYVLDASALLAYLRNEPGAERVEKAIGDGAIMSTVNLAEVLSKLSDVGEDPDEVTLRLRNEGIVGGMIEVKVTDEDDALEIARLRPRTKVAGLSLGDRACLALGRIAGCPVLTADRAWEKLRIGIHVEVVR